MLCWNGALYLPCTLNQKTVTAPATTGVTEGILPSISLAAVTTSLGTVLTTYKGSNGQNIISTYSGYVTALEQWTGYFYPPNATGQTITITTVKTTTSTPSTTVYTSIASGAAGYTKTVTGSTANTVIIGKLPNAQTTSLSTLDYGAASVSLISIDDNSIFALLTRAHSRRRLWLLRLHTAGRTHSSSDGLRILQSAKPRALPRV